MMVKELILILEGLEDKELDIETSDGNIEGIRKCKDDEWYCYYIKGKN